MRRIWRRSACRPARCLEHGAPHRAQPRRQTPHLRSLPGAVHALESDEQAASRHSAPRLRINKNVEQLPLSHGLAIAGRGPAPPAGSWAGHRPPMPAGWVICPTTRHPRSKPLCFSAICPTGRGPSSAAFYYTQPEEPMNFDQAPMLVIWEVTQACDLACVHCRASLSPSATRTS